jgi:hypothetical protein
MLSDCGLRGGACLDSGLCIHWELMQEHAKYSSIHSIHRGRLANSIDLILQEI